MERFKQIWHRFRLPLIGLAVVATVATAVLTSYLQGQPLVLNAAAEPSPSPEPLMPPTIVVDIEGAVAKPGVRELPGGSLVVDAIKAAGGFAPDADRAYVARKMNQAEALKDHQKVYVPLLGEEMEDSSASSSSDGDTNSSGDSGDLVNLNTATIEELDTLPGVGPATAEHIIDYREAFGPFEKVEDLLEVSGIGEAKLAKLKGKVTV